MSPDALQDRVVAYKNLPGAKTPEGKAAMEAFRAKRKISARKAQKFSRIVGLLALIATPVGIYFWGTAPWTYIPPLFIFLLLEDAKPDLLMTKMDYYAFPGSKTKSGNHLCIYCGQHEVEVHHYGRSGTIVRTYCAHCDNLLFRD